MGINMENEITKITEEAKKRGHDVRIRDVAYAMLRVRLRDSNIAFTVVFGTPTAPGDIPAYEALESTKYLMRFFEKDLAPKEIEKKSNEEIIKALTKNKKTDSDGGSITFEENRAGMEEQIREIREAITKGMKEETLDEKTFGVLQKTLADLRSRLNDKFGAAEKSAEQYIVVQPKFNTICNITHRECWCQTKSFAMEHWHLIPDPNYKE